MTRDEFIYGLKACGFTAMHGRIFYEEDELIKCFTDLDFFTQPLEQMKEGHWIDEKVRWRCSECDWWYPDWKKFNFCPNCGAKMEVSK